MDLVSQWDGRSQVANFNLRSRWGQSYVHMRESGLKLQTSIGFRNHGEGSRRAFLVIVTTD